MYDSSHIGVTSGVYRVQGLRAYRGVPFKTAQRRRWLAKGARALGLPFAGCDVSLGKRHVPTHLKASSWGQTSSTLVNERHRSPAKIQSLSTFRSEV